MTEYMVKRCILASYGIDKLSGIDRLFQQTTTIDELIEKIMYFNTVKYIMDILMNKDMEVEERMFLLVKKKNILTAGNTTVE